MNKRENIKRQGAFLLNTLREAYDEIALGKCLGEPMKDHVDEVRVTQTKNGLWEATIFFKGVSE